MVTSWNSRPHRSCAECHRHFGTGGDGSPCTRPARHAYVGAGGWGMPSLPSINQPASHSTNSRTSTSLRESSVRLPAVRATSGAADTAPRRRPALSRKPATEPATSARSACSPLGMHGHIVLAPSAIATSAPGVRISVPVRLGRHAQLRSQPRQQVAHRVLLPWPPGLGACRSLVGRGTTALYATPSPGHGHA
jgi:hypothetical protein